MASPVAHSLAGAIIYLAANRRRPFRWAPFWAVVIAANLADFDLLPGILLGHHSMFHRTFSHSLFAAAVVTAATYIIVHRKAWADPVRITVLVGLALLSQLLIDWFTLDAVAPHGIALFWPFSHEYYMSEHIIFLNIERNHVTTMPVILHNLKAVGLELMILGGPFLLLWWQRGRQHLEKSATY